MNIAKLLRTAFFMKHSGGYFWIMLLWYLSSEFWINAAYYPISYLRISKFSSLMGKIENQWSRSIRKKMFRYAQFSCSTHCVKSVQIRSFFWSIFSCMWLCKPNTHTILHKRHGNCAKSYFPPSSLNKTEKMNYFEHNNKLDLYRKLQTALKWIRRAFKHSS